MTENQREMLTHYFGDGNDDCPDLNDDGFPIDEATEEEWAYWSNRWPAEKPMADDVSTQDLPF